MLGDKRATQVLLLVLCLVVVSLPQIGVVKAIYISEDGNIEGTDKIQREENLYTLTDNIDNNTITVLKDDVVIDGAGHILRGHIALLHRNNVTIKNFAITTSSTSDNIFVWYCSNCTILNNTITPFVEPYPCKHPYHLLQRFYSTTQKNPQQPQQEVSIKLIEQDKESVIEQAQIPIFSLHHL